MTLSSTQNKIAAIDILTSEMIDRAARLEMCTLVGGGVSEDVVGKKVSQAESGRSSLLIETRIGAHVHVQEVG